MVPQVSDRLVAPGLRRQASGSPSPRFSSFPRIIRRTLLHKITQDPIPYNFPDTEKSEMSQHHSNENINNSFNNTNSFNNVWNNCTVTDERSEILAWLSPLEPQSRHHDIRARRIDDVGGWFLQTKEYRNWFGGVRGGKSDCSTLFCYGGPGVGKTYIR